MAIYVMCPKCQSFTLNKRSKECENEHCESHGRHRSESASRVEPTVRPIFRDHFAVEVNQPTESSDRGRYTFELGRSARDVTLTLGAILLGSIALIGWSNPEVPGAGSPWAAISVIAVPVALMWLLFSPGAEPRRSLAVFPVLWAIAWMPSCGGLSTLARVTHPVPENFSLPGYSTNVPAIDAQVQSIEGMFVASASFETATGESWDVSSTNEASWGSSIGGGPGSGAPRVEPVTVRFAVHIPRRPELRQREITGTLKGSITYPAYSGAGTFSEQTTSVSVPLVLHIGTGGLFERLQVDFFAGVSPVDSVARFIGGPLWLGMIYATARLVIKRFA